MFPVHIAVFTFAVPLLLISFLISSVFLMFLFKRIFDADVPCFPYMCFIARVIGYFIHTYVVLLNLAFRCSMGGCVISMYGLYGVRM